MSQIRRRSLRCSSVYVAPPALLALAAGTAMAQTEEIAQVPQQVPQTVTVTSQRNPDSGLTKLQQDVQQTPQSIDVSDQHLMTAENATRLQDALRYMPGVTLNSGEGGAHGDSVNLRGFDSDDDFFLDGIRDPGTYARDNFDTESVEILQGPSAVLFGNGSAGGAINQVSKQPTLAPQLSGTLEFGTNAEFRGTADIDRPIGEDAAFRVNVMGEKSDVADRDDVEQKRWGIAPSIVFGLHEPDRVTLSFFHQEENNIPDYGVPFLWGAPAPVPRNTYYGLKDDDVSQTNVNIMTAEWAHKFTDTLSLTETIRYANYWSNYRVSAPHFGDDFTGGAPAPGTPLDDIVVYRDRPSSEGTQTYLTSHSDLVAKFSTGDIGHTVVTGFEIGRQTNDLDRFDNEFQGIDGIAPTPLLAPDANEAAPAQVSIDAEPSTTADMQGVYAIDTIQLAPQWSANLGLRFDRYATSFDEPLSDSRFARVDSAVSPRASVSFKPDDTQTYYVAYGTSFDPPISYLVLAPDSTGPAPEKARSVEIGAKTAWLSGLLFADAALFRTDTSNVLVSDPDDPTLQEMPGTRQRVQGGEVSLTGHLTTAWEINANVTAIDPRITESSDPLEVGRLLPNAARFNANLWTDYEVADGWVIGTGVNWLGHRYADGENTANIPAYAVWNAMAAWQATDQLHVQLNASNITDEVYYTGSYWSDPTENHVIPGAGRTVTLSLAWNY